MKKLILFLLLIPSFLKSNGQDPVIIPSLEWSIARADLIVTGKIIHTETSKGKGGDPRVSVHFLRSGTLRGSSGQDTLFLSIDSWEPDSVESMIGKEFLLFLTSTPSGYRSGGHSYHLWPTKGKDGTPLIMPLDEPFENLFKAKDLSKVKDLRSLKKVIRTVSRVEKEKGADRRTGLPGTRFVRAPSLDELNEENRSTFLRVPAFMFPEADEKAGP